MSKVSVTQVFPSTAASLWSAVGDPAGLPDWHPAIATSLLGADGCSRVCTLADGGEVREEITARDDDARSYSYRIVESPLPLKNYRSRLRVSRTEGGASVTWESEFEAVGIPAADLEAMIRGLYEAGLGALRASME